MKLALVQLNPVVGDIKGNVAKTIRFIREAQKQEADLVIFPELSILGYPPRDLLDLPYLVDEACAAISKILPETKGLAVVVGGVEKNNQNDGKGLYNAAFWLEDGKLVRTFRKSLLPFYDVFDESRYFEPGQPGPGQPESGQPSEPVEYKGIKIGVTVCEDIWTDDKLWKKNPYHQDPVATLAKAGTELLINISASPYSLDRFETRWQLVRQVARKNNLLVAYVNQVGGNDELIFDGGSMVMSGDGELARAPFFKEGITIVDLASSMPRSFEMPQRLQLLEEALTMGLEDYVRKCGFKKVTLGLSGGIDSALVAHLAVKALGKKNVIGLMMPSAFTSRSSLKDAQELAENLGIEIKNIPISGMQREYLKSFQKIYGKKKSDTTEENIQARIRGNLLMALSNKLGHLVLSTGNKSELAVGYCTLYGDMSGGLAVIADVPKTIVYELARFMNKKGKPIPESTLTKAPTAELRHNQKDQDSLPPYDVLDAVIKGFIEDGRSETEIIASGISSKIVKKVLRLIKLNEYKRRQAAPGLRVTSKAFGMGRRFPIASRF